MTWARLTLAVCALAFSGGALSGCDAELEDAFDDDPVNNTTDNSNDSDSSSATVTEPGATLAPTDSATVSPSPSDTDDLSEPEPSTDGAGGSGATTDTESSGGDPATIPTTDNSADPTSSGETDSDSGVQGPLLVDSEPDPLSMDVDPDVVLVLRFDRAVHAGAGDLALIDTINGNVIETAPIGDERIQFDASSVSVDFSVTLARGFNYALTVSSGAILDADDAPFVGLIESDAFTFTAAAAAPVALVTTLPLLDDVAVALDTSITLTFDTGVRAGPGGSISVLEQSSGVVFETFLPSDTTHVTINETEVVLDLSQDLAYDTTYYVTVEEQAITSMDGAPFAGFDDDTVLAFTTEAPPELTLVDSSPSADAKSVDPATGLTLNFSEPVSLGSGSIEIRAASDDAVVQALDIADAQLLNNSVTLTWGTALANATEYYVAADAGIVVSGLGALYAGIDDPDTLSFKTAAAPPPPFELVSTTPLKGTVGVAVDSNLKLTFDANVVFGSGVVAIVRTDTDVVVESIPAGDSRVSVSNMVVTINPTTQLNGNTSYYVLVTPGSYESDQGATFAGISDKTAFQFTTENSFDLVDLGPIPNEIDISPATDLVLTFTDPVEAGDGDIEIRAVNSGEVFESIPSDNSRVTIAGAVVTIDLDSILAPSTEYSVAVTSGALREASSDTAFAGIDAANWSFTTRSVNRPGDVSSGMMVWLDADYDASVKLGTGVRVWADRSGLRHNVRQSTAGAQPSRVANSLNTHSVIRFDGDDDQLLAAESFSLTAFEGFVVWRSSIAPSTSAQRAILINGANFELDHSHTGGATNSLVTCVGDDCTDVAAWYSAKFVPTPVADQPYLWDFGFDTVTTSLFTRTQGSSAVFQPAPTKTPAATTQPFAVGGNDAYCATTDGCHFLGDLAEVLLYSRTLTQAERLAVTSYLRTKWGTAAPTCNADEVLGPNGSCYFVHTAKGNWDSGRAACQGRGAGWDLASIRTQADDTFMIGLLTDDAWIGATDSAVADTWRWVTDTYQFWSGTSAGSPTNGAFVHWASGEPSSGPTEGCGRYRIANQAWADVACIDNYNSLCEGPTN